MRAFYNFLFGLINLFDVFIVPRWYMPERRFIKNSAKEIFQVLGLEPIPITFCDEYQSCCYNKANGIITMGFPLLQHTSDEWDFVFDYVDADFDDREGKVFFIIAHEIAHYLQHTRFPRWMKYHEAKEDYQNLKNDTSMSAEKYRQFKIEAHADKVAINICKKFGYCS